MSKSKYKKLHFVSLLRKSELVEDIEAGVKAWNKLNDEVKSRFENPNEIAAWWYDPTTHKVDRYGEALDSCIQIGLFVAVLEAILAGTREAVKKGGKMSREEAEERKKLLDEKSEDGRYELWKEEIAKMRLSS